MKTCEFKKSGGPLKVNFKVKNGVLAAAYFIKLSEKDSSQAVAVYEGDNQNPEDDEYQLPTPENANDGRILRLISDFIGLDLEMSKTYCITLEIYQDDKLICFFDNIGDLTGSTQSLLKFIKLKMAE
jgi:hypothetical protein